MATPSFCCVAWALRRPSEDPLLAFIHAHSDGAGWIGGIVLYEILAYVVHIWQQVMLQLKIYFLHLHYTLIFMGILACGL